MHSNEGFFKKYENILYSVVGGIFHIISAIVCLILGLIFIVDVAGIEFLASNEPPFEWTYILIGMFDISAFFIGVISAIFLFLRKGFRVTVASSIVMIIAGSSEFHFDAEGFYVILLCCIIAIVCGYKTQLEKAPTHSSSEHH